MAWLLHQGEVLASAEVATGIVARMRWVRLCQRAPVVVLGGGHSLHSFGAAQELLAVYCDDEMSVLAIRAIHHSKVHLYPHSTKWAVLAPMELGRRWSISVGDELELRLNSEQR